jgi:hypothetical protein
MSSMLKKGNQVAFLPKSIRKSIQNGKFSSSGQLNLPHSSFLLNKETIYLPNGNKITLNLTSRIRFDLTTFRRYKSGNTVINETTYHYVIEYEWS